MNYNNGKMLYKYGFDNIDPINIDPINILFLNYSFKVVTRGNVQRENVFLEWKCILYGDNMIAKIF